LKGVTSRTIAVASFLAAQSPALAQPTAPLPSSSDEGAKLYEEAVKHYNLAEYDAAIRAFKAAYLATEAPELLYDIAQSYRLKGPGNCTSALQFYRNYLRVAPATPKRSAVEAAIGDMEACSRNEAVASSPVVQAETTGLGPPPAPLAVPLGEAVHGVSPGHHGVPGWLAPVVGGLGLGLAASGAALLAWSRIDYESIEASGCAPRCSTAVVSGPSERQTLGAVLSVAGGATVGAGVIIFLVRRGSVHGSSGAWLVPSVRGLRGGFDF
jgi:tetratricopeptide (TPR) repeat protein